MRISPAQPTILFQGHFDNLKTYTLANNGASGEGNISSEALEQLLSQMRQKHPDVIIDCNPTAYPAHIHTAGRESRAADFDLQEALFQRQVTFDYSI